MSELSDAQRMMLKADEILSAVDDSFIITQRNHKPRLLPSFRPEEITLGKILGKGGFGVVHGIDKFTLDPEEQEYQEKRAEQEVADSLDRADGDDDNDKRERRVSTVATTPEDLSRHGSHVHYDVRKARHWMDKRCERDGAARYALKRLHSTLNEFELARGMIDLAVEAKYLSIVWHPNIGTLIRGKVRLLVRTS